MRLFHKLFHKLFLSLLLLSLLALLVSGGFTGVWLRNRPWTGEDRPIVQRIADSLDRAPWARVWLLDRAGAIQLASQSFAAVRGPHHPGADGDGLMGGACFTRAAPGAALIFCPAQALFTVCSPPIEVFVRIGS